MGETVALHLCRRRTTSSVKYLLQPWTVGLKFLKITSFLVIQIGQQRRMKISKEKSLQQGFQFWKMWWICNWSAKLKLGSRIASEGPFPPWIAGRERNCVVIQMHTSPSDRSYSRYSVCQQEQAKKKILCFPWQEVFLSHLKIGSSWEWPMSVM